MCVNPISYFIDGDYFYLTGMLLFFFLFIIRYSVHVKISFRSLKRKLEVIFIKKIIFIYILFILLCFF